VSTKEPVNDVLEQFREIPNRDMIIEDSDGVKYKLLTLLVNGYRYNYQRFVWGSNKRMYRIGTKEPNVRLKKYEGKSHFYLGFPVIQHVPISTVLMHNVFETEK